MIDPGAHILAVVLLAALVLSLAFAAVRLRRRLLPGWDGAPATLVDAVLAVALLVWLAQLLGLFGLLYAWSLVGGSLLVAGAVALLVPRAGGAATGGRRDRARAGPAWPYAVAATVVAVVFALWGLTAADALGRGIFNFDSLWYHMPFAAEIARSGSVTGLHHTETVFTNWFYPQGSELLHAVGILLTERDTLSLFLNFGWLAMAFLAAWCIGRPYGVGHLSIVAVAIVLGSHTLVVREPGSAKNDIMAAALLLASIAILVNAWSVGRPREAAASWIGWPLAAAGVAAGLAVGTKSTVLAVAAALSVAVVVLAPAGRRRAAAAWWFLPAFAAGGFWYLRNLVVAGNPIPQVERLGPISLPHPEQLQSGRPDFSVAHYATDTGVWRDYFGPGLEHAFGVLWPLVVGGALLGGLLAAIRPAPASGPGEHRRDPLRWLGAVALLGLLAYVFTPLGAAGAEGAPEAFRINLRFAVPALLAGLALLPIALLGRPAGRSQAAVSRGLLAWALLGVLLIVFALTDRPDAVLRDPDRLFAWVLVLTLVVPPLGLWALRRRGLAPAPLAAGVAAWALALALLGYPLQRDYLEDRFRNDDPRRAIPGMGLDSAYRWATDVRDARIGLAGTTAGFLQYGFYGTDLSNRVIYLGEPGSRGAFLPIPDCRGFRAAVNEAQLDYLVTAPFLNFIQPNRPIPSPEAAWLRGSPAVTPLDRTPRATVWHLRGRLDPAACGPANAPLRHIPQQPE